MRQIKYFYTGIAFYIGFLSTFSLRVKAFQLNILLYINLKDIQSNK